MNDHLPPGHPKAERGGYTVLWLAKWRLRWLQHVAAVRRHHRLPRPPERRGIDLLWHPSLSLASGTDVIALLQSVLDGHTCGWTRCASRARCCAAPTAQGGSTCWRAPACP
jgi:hypothetical protein